MFGAHDSQIATLVERQTRYMMLAKVASEDTETVVDALIETHTSSRRSCRVTHLGSG